MEHPDKRTRGTFNDGAYLPFTLCIVIGSLRQSDLDRITVEGAFGFCGLDEYVEVLVLDFDIYVPVTVHLDRAFIFGEKLGFLGMGTGLGGDFPLAALVSFVAVAVHKR
jgi:hypothetical protein